MKRSDFLKTFAAAPLAVGIVAEVELPTEEVTDNWWEGEASHWKEALMERAHEDWMKRQASKPGVKVVASPRTRPMTPDEARKLYIEP